MTMDQDRITHTSYTPPTNTRATPPQEQTHKKGSLPPY